MFDELVRQDNVFQRESYGNVKALPAGLKSLINGASRLDLGIGGNIVADVRF